MSWLICWVTCSDLKCLSLFNSSELISGYRPVIIMHGILSNAETMTELVQFVKKAHPGTEVYNVDLYDDLVSF